MADPSTDHTTGRAGTPVWLKVFGIVVLLPVVLGVALVIAGGGHMGPPPGGH